MVQICTNVLLSIIFHSMFYSQVLSFNARPSNQCKGLARRLASHEVVLYRVLEILRLLPAERPSALSSNHVHLLELC